MDRGQRVSKKTEGTELRREKQRQEVQEKRPHLLRVCKWLRPILPSEHCQTIQTRPSTHSAIANLLATPPQQGAIKNRIITYPEATMME